MLYRNIPVSTLPDDVVDFCRATLRYQHNTAPGDGLRFYLCGTALFALGIELCLCPPFSGQRNSYGERWMTRRIPKAQRPVYGERLREWAAEFSAHELATLVHKHPPLGRALALLRPAAMTP